MIQSARLYQTTRRQLLTPSALERLIRRGIALRVPITRRLRTRASAAGIDLRRPFFFPPDDPRFDEIITQVKRERDARIARLRRDKRKFASAKARGRRQDIAAAPRVKHVDYQLAAQEMA